ncbi:MAG TPA: hypothetical protein ENI42_07070 [Thermoplasmatales archaeon]|nr:hypothetical protein [Thermoplasmatales archaeon]
MEGRKIIVVLMLTTISLSVAPSFVSNALTEPLEDKTLMGLFEGNFSVSIVKPRGYVYFFNMEIARLLPVFPMDAIVVGPVTVEVEVENGPVDKVEFYVDGVLKETDMVSPFEWTWDEHSLVPPIHSLKVVAYSGEETVSDEMFLIYINPFRHPMPPGC